MSFGRLLRAMLPFYLPLGGLALLLITYWPGLALWLPACSTASEPSALLTLRRGRPPAAAVADYDRGARFCLQVVASQRDFYRECGLLEPLHARAGS